LKIVVKELKETRTCLKLIRRKELIKPAEKLDAIFLENEELVAIISKSIETAKRNKTERTKNITRNS